MRMKRFRTFMEALYRLYEHSGFALASAVAFSFIVSVFPFCIFLGSLSGVFGGRELADAAILQLFTILPEPVAKGLAPEVQAIMGTRRIDLLTASGFLALFFATSALETMRAALNNAYRVHETRAYPLCLLISMSFVFVSAVSTLVLTWAVVVGPALAEGLQPAWTKKIMEVEWIGSALHFLEQIWVGPLTRYTLAGVIIALQLLPSICGWPPESAASRTCGRELCFPSRCGWHWRLCGQSIWRSQTTRCSTPVCRSS